MSLSYLKKLLQRGTTSTEIFAQATPTGEALVAAGMAPHEEITRSGYGFHCISTMATAAVVAIPSRAAGIALYNAADDGGKSIIIDAVFAINLVGHGVLSQSGLIVVLGQTDVAALGGALVVRKNNGYGPGDDSVADVAAGGGTVLDAVTGVAIGWVPVGDTGHQSVISLPGAILWADLDGRFIVPPGRQFGVNVISSNVENTFNCGIMWHEKQLTLN